MKATKMEYYDSHAQVKALIESGIKTKQAEAIVKTLQLTRSTDIANLATKDQLNLVEGRLSARIEKLDAKIEKLDAKIEKVASDVVIKILFWVLPMFVAIMVAIFLR